MHRTTLLSASALASGLLLAAQPALAQSTGSVDFEQPIIVTGKLSKSVAGVETPDTPKAKQVLDQAIISR
ncbi:hypothetical protein ABTM90_20445, partial [Acinetobacter baumannii]